MASKIRKGFAAVGAIAFAMMLLIVSMVSPALSTTQDFSIFNSGWNGTSGLAVRVYEAGKFTPSFEVRASGSSLEVAQVGIEELSLNPLTDALVVIGPSETYSKAEGELVADFVANGGVLLLADDFGTGNSLLANMNATSRFSGVLAMDLSFEKQPEFSVCFDITQSELTRNVTTLLLNHPSTLTTGGNTQVLAKTSIASWLDSSGDGLQQPGEPRGPFPILAVEDFGIGSIVLLSDPSVLINGMKPHLGNSALAESILDYVSHGRASVYFDESHRDFIDPVSVTLEFAGAIGDNAKIALISIAFVLALWILTDIPDKFLSRLVRKVRELVRIVFSITVGILLKRKSAAKSVPMSRDDLVAELSKMHPDWRETVIRHIVREKSRHAEALVAMDQDRTSQTLLATTTTKSRSPP